MNLIELKPGDDVDASVLEHNFTEIKNAISANANIDARIDEEIIPVLAQLKEADAKTKNDLSSTQQELLTEIDSIKEDAQEANNLPHIIKVSPKSLLPSFYIVYSNGLCLQGGSVTVPATLELKLLIPYLDDKYNASASTTSWEWEDSNGTITEKTKSTIKLKALRWHTASATAHSTLNFDWHALGYINLEEV